MYEQSVTSSPTLSVIPSQHRSATLAIFSHYVTKQTGMELAMLPPLEAMKQILTKPPRERPSKALEYLSDFTHPIRFFSELGSEAHYQCCQHMSYLFAREGEYLFRKGDLGSQFFVILDGKCGVMLPVREGSETFTEVLTYTTGDSFGELAVIKNQPRAASILCKTDCHFGVLEREDFLRIIGKLKELKLIRKVEFMQKLTMFRRWTKGSLIKLSYYFRERTYRRKQVVFSVGDEASEIYFITKGEFQLMQTVQIPGSLNALQKRRGSISLLAEVTVLSTDHVFGEEEVIEGQPRQFTCMCRSEFAEVLVLSKEVRTIQDFIKRVTNEETIKYLRKMNAKKADFREERLKAITILETLKKEVPIVKVQAEGTGDTHLEQKILFPTSPQFSHSIKQESLSSALSRLEKESRSVRSSESPMAWRQSSPLLYPQARSPPAERESLKPEAKHSVKKTWDQFLALKLTSKPAYHTRSKSEKVINIHTEKQKQLWRERELSPKITAAFPPISFLKKTVNEVQLEISSFAAQPQQTDVRVKTYLKKSPHHLFRMSQGALSIREK